MATVNYTPLLQLALPTTGDLSGTWGDTVNNNITSMIEQAVAGMATINTWTTNSHTLTVANGTTDEARCAMLVFATGSGGTALTAAGTAICPATTKLYIAKNTAAYAVTLKTASGSGVSVPPNQTLILMCDGTNVVTASSSLSGAQMWLVSAVSGTSIDLSLSNYYTKTISADTTFTLTNTPPSGTAAVFYLELTNAGAYTTVFWSGVKWANNTSPSLTAYGTDILQFSTDDGGTTWYGRKIGAYGALTRSTALNLDGNCFGSSNDTYSIIYNTYDDNLYAYGAYFSLASCSAYGTTLTKAGAWNFSNGLQLALGTSATNASVTTTYMFTGTTNIPFVVGDSFGRIASYSSTSWTLSQSLLSTAWGTASSTAIVSGVYVNGSTKFIVGGQNGKIAYSPDSYAWTNVTTLSATTFGTSQTVTLLLTNGTTAVAVGSTAGVGTSTDGGVTWTYQAGLLTAWTSGTPVAGAYGNSIYMVLGQSGKLATSSDGVTWTNRAALAATAFGTASPIGPRSVVYTGTAWVVTSSTGIIAASTDNGVTWTAYTTLQTALGGTTPNTFGGVLGLCNGVSGTVMAYGSAGMFAYSTDNGATWTQYDGPAQNQSVFLSLRNSSTVSSLIWSGTVFMAVGKYGAATSYDGVTWKTRTAGFRNKYNVNNSNSNTYPVLAYGNGVHLTAVQSSNARVFTTSDNGATWTYQSGLNSVYPSLVIYSAVYGNSRFVIGGTQTSQSRTPYSTDGGVTWTAASGPYSTAPLYVLAFGNGIFLTGSLSGRLATSTTAATGSWTDYQATINATTFGTATVSAIAYGNSTYVVIGSGGVVVTSTDAVTWTYRGGLVSAWTTTFGSGTTGVTGIIVEDVTWTGSEFVVVGYLSSVPVMATSSDGITWTDRSAQLPSLAATSPYGLPLNSLYSVASNGVTTVMGGNVANLVIR